MKKIWQIKVDAFSTQRYEAKSELMIYGSKAYKPKMKELFTHVATIDVDTAEEAFELTNLWNNPNKVHWKGKCHSLSVGDVVEFEDGKWFMVDDFGFTEV